jgi:hypothetical protein
MVKKVNSSKLRATTGITLSGKSSFCTDNKGTTIQQ